MKRYAFGGAALIALNFSAAQWIEPYIQNPFIFIFWFPIMFATMGVGVMMMAYPITNKI